MPAKKKSKAKTKPKKSAKKKGAKKKGAKKKGAKKKPATKKPKKRAMKKKATKRRNSMAYGVRSMGPMRFAAVVAGDPRVAWNTMMPLKSEQGLTGQALAAFWMNDGGGMKAYAACVEVSERDAIGAPLVEQRVEASSYAYTSFVGPFEKLGETWAWFMGHVKNIGHTIDMSRPFLEIYKSDGKSSADGLPRTELCVPI